MRGTVCFNDELMVHMVGRFTILVESNNDNLQEQTRDKDVCAFRSEVTEGYLVVKVHTSNLVGLN
jgi:hypothetical protein